MSQLSTPILFLIFNRPDTTAQVFEALRKVRPKYLYVAADGPRIDRIGEKEKCEAARAIIRQIDWDCKVQKLYREQNLGCKVAVSSAIDWFFLHEEEGIILEDDCLPNKLFFTYCSNLLKKYRTDDRIMHIGGVSFLKGKDTGEPHASYYFSRDPYVWGWATWKRAWNLYDVNLKLLPKILESGMMKKFYPDTLEGHYWENIFRNTFDGKINTWDYQWKFAVLCNHGLCVVPKNNMVINIGFGADATHTGSNDTAFTMAHENIEEIVHPKIIAVDLCADAKVFRQYIYVNSLRKIYIRIKEYFKK
jgi:hypothetical protein